MIIKLNNKDGEFYNYMGRFFGSRTVQRQTGDRMYDDDDKTWYIFLDHQEPVAFLSINKKVIKNIYGIEDKYIKELLDKVHDELIIEPSILTKAYINIYQDSKFKIIDTDSHINYVTICSNK